MEPYFSEIDASDASGTRTTTSTESPGPKRLSRKGPTTLTSVPVAVTRTASAALRSPDLLRIHRRDVDPDVVARLGDDLDAPHLHFDADEGGSGDREDGHVSAPTLSTARTAAALVALGLEGSGDRAHEPGVE